jgi:hypothetical protein
MHAFSHSWLRTKGCNTYELIPTTLDGESIESLSIKQGFAPYSDSVYRSQTINIGLVYEDFTTEVIEYVCI